MIRPLSRAAVVALLLSFTLAGCGRGARPLARIGERTITVDDFVLAATGNELQYPAPPAQAKAALLEDLVRREMMLEAARLRGDDTTALARNFRRTTEERLVLQALYERMAPQDPGVSAAETREFWRWRGEQDDAHLVYSLDRRTIEAAAAQLGLGAPFEQVANEFNMPGMLPPGGALPGIVPGSLISPLDQALRSLPLHKVGGPYETPQGWFLLEVSARSPAKRPALEVVQSQLAEVIRQRKLRQTLSGAMTAMKHEYHAGLEPGAPQEIFQALTPYRVGGEKFSPTPNERRRVLARWDGGLYTLDDALADLERPDNQKPSASLLPAIESWLEGRMLVRLSLLEAGRRHLREEPAIARRVRTEFERYVLESEYGEAVRSVGQPDETALRAIWEAVKGQYAQVQQVRLQSIVVPDSALAFSIVHHGMHGSGLLADAVKMADASLGVTEQTIRFPTADPNWAPMRSTFARMVPREWAGPERVPAGWRLMQVVDKVQASPAFENLPPELMQGLASNAMQLAQEKRFVAYSDSLRRVLRPVLFADRLRPLPWPMPRASAVGP